ncbi:hypothetical protein [Stutzerimonas xanthomarina]|uniref:hypothetical protein n=1 Tax=Stutzerimonas xanthomarina TaxID=271420 RepID=UPI003AA848DC
MQPRYLKRLEGLLNQFGASHGRGLASDHLEDIGQATRQGQVATLLVEPSGDSGHVDKTDGTATPTSEDDVNTPIFWTSDHLDTRARWNVVVVPTERMPTGTGAAAIYRF